MFTSADDATLGIPVEKGAYPEGEAGIQQSLATICKKIREGAPTAVMKSFAGNVIKQSGSPTSFKARSAALLDHVRKAVAYAPDALGTEQIQTAMVSLCVEGAPICIPIGDCDDLVVALGTLCAAAGMDVEVVRQFFGEEHQQHVLLEVKLEDGTWFPLDPSSRMMIAGQKARATHETRCSPWDGAVTGLSDQAEFVGIGGLPVWKWEGMWRLLHESEIIGPAMAPRTRFGTGAIWEGAAALQPQIDWLGQIWSVIDPKGRTWAQCNADALERARAGTWPADDLVAKADFTALLITSAYQAHAIQSMPGVGQEWSDTILRTWVVFSKKIGIDPSQYKASDIRARMVQDGASQANLALIDVLLILAGGLVIAGTLAVVFYFGTTIINNLISKYYVDQDLMRKEAEGQRILDKHLNDPSLPQTPAEQEYMKQLWEAQNKALATQGEVPNTIKPIDTSKPLGGTDPWVWVGLAALVGGTVLAVVYREEIKQALSSGGRKRLAA